MKSEISRRTFLGQAACAVATVAVPASALSKTKANAALNTQKKIGSNQKVLILHGSPNIDGNTGKLVKIFSNEMEKRGHTVERVNIAEKEITPCIGCMTCQETTGELGCIYEDEGTTLLNAMISADMVVITSPLYFATFTSQIKPLIDRSLAFVSGLGTKNHKSLVKGKKTFFISTGAGGYKKNGEILEGSYNDMIRFLAFDSYGFFYAQSSPKVSEQDQQRLIETVNSFA